VHWIGRKSPFEKPSASKLFEVKFPRALILFLAVASLFSMSACGPYKYKSLPPPPTTIRPLDKDVVLTNYASFHWLVAPGRTTTTKPNLSGNATLNGSVTGPDGAVQDATVVLEYFAGQSSSPVSTQTTTGSDGKWSVSKLPGGRYRVRAFRAPDLGVTQAQPFFLGGTDTKSITINLQEFNGYVLNAGIAPNPPIYQQQATIAVRVSQNTVGSNGIISSVPVNAVAVTATISQSMTLLSTATVVTNSDGYATFLVKCSTLGAALATFVVPGSLPASPQLPACSAPKVTTSSSTTTTKKK
jgi:hypothetical protein